MTWNWGEMWLIVGFRTSGTDKALFVAKSKEDTVARPWFPPRIFFHLVAKGPVCRLDIPTHVGP